MNFLKTLILTVTLLLGVVAQAGLGITYHGRMLKSNNEPVTGSVQFRIQILSPGTEKCLMYQETQNHTIDDGIFSLTIGSGTRSVASVDGGFSIDRVFANRGSFDFSATSPAGCYFGSSYIPNTADSRIVKVFFNDGGGWDEMPEQSISWSPYAINSHSVGGFTKDELLRVEGGTAAPLSMTDYNKLTALIQGTSLLYATPSTVSAALSGLSPLATMNPTGTASNTTFLRGDGVWATPPSGGGGGGGGTVIEVKGTAGQISVADGTSEAVLSLVNSGVTAGTYGAINKTFSTLSVDAFGRITALTESPIALNANQITAGVLGVAQGGTGSSSLAANRLLMVNGLGTGVTADACVIGQTLKFDGTNWQCEAAPTAPTVGTTAGTFAAGNDARIVASANAFMKDGSVVATGHWDIGNHRITNVTNPVSGQDVATKNYVDSAMSAAGAGTVTSVSGTSGQLTVVNDNSTPVISLANSGVTAGAYGATNKTLSSITVDAFGRITTLTESPIALNANQITAGILGVAQGGTGSSSFTANRLLMANGLGTGLISDACVLGQILKFDGTNWQCEAAPTVPTVGTTAGTFAAGDDARIVASTNAFMIGGNTKTADLSLGTNDNQALSFITNNLARMKIQDDGNIGIGIAGVAGEKLEVGGKVKAAEFCIGATCLSAWPTGGGVAEVTTTAPLSVSGGTSAPALSLNIGSGLETASSSLAVKAGTGITVAAGGVNVVYGTTAGTAVQGNDSRLSDSRAPTGSAGGDLGGTYPNPSVAKIQGRSVASTAPTVGQVFKWDGSAWVPSADAGITSETDPTVPSWAKGALPTCSPGQVLFANGSTISCVTVDVVSQDPGYRCDAGSQTYSTAGSYSFDMFDIPSGCTDVKVEVKGAGGGSGANFSGSGMSANGDAGGYAEFYLNRQGISNLNMVIGGGGGGGSATSSTGGGLAGTNGGGVGGSGPSYGAGGGGGGRTEVSIDSTLVAVIGGGGGGGGHIYANSTNAPANHHGGDATTSAVGLRATSSSGTNNSSDGSGTSGGKGSDTGSYGGGGGGGGGCYGGGGGSSSSATRGGAGGSGSSCIQSSYLLSGYARQTGGNNGGAGITYSASTRGNNGDNGSITVSWGPTLNQCVPGSVNLASAGNHIFNMFDIPSRCRTVKVTVKGAGGGSGANLSGSGWGANGNAGGYAEFYLNRQGISNLNMVIGGGGGGGSTTSTTAGGLAGTNGGAVGGSGPSYGAGGGGGGRTEVSIDSTLVAVIGGGGGSGGQISPNFTNAAASYQGSDATTSAVGLRATLSTGGNNSSDGSGTSGGKGSDTGSYGGGGGGGGGCYGGGGGGSSSGTRAGAGGSGSSCIQSSYLLSGYARQTGGNNGGAGITYTANTRGNNGENGSILIEWSP